jgi:DNA-binding PadR family transcriptional regulator
MHHKNFHDRDSRHDCGKRFARGELRHDGHHIGRGRHGRGGWSNPSDLELRRFFAHGDLRLVILRLIAEKPRHGYEIIKEIEERVAGAYSPSPGVIYPTLTLLEELGYVAVSPGEGSRKLHEITEAGRAFLTANREAVDALFARMEEANQARGGGPEPRILRAMENLKFALRLRHGRGPLSEEQVTAVTAALDSAAVSVERT